MTPGRRLSLYPLIVTSTWALLSAIVIGASLYLTDGRLNYTLDDPYIALKMANVVLGGGYGVNASEYSSPASSMIFLYLVAATQRLGLGPAGPLVLDLFAAAGSVYLGALFIERYVLGDTVTRKTAWFAYPLGVALIFALSAVALPMVGLEHSWHVLVIVVMLFGFARVLSTGGETPPSLVAAIVLTPLLRFEGVASSFAAIAALAYLGRWRAAMTAAALILMAFATYFFAMLHLGLPLLPGSVTLKFQVAESVEHLSGGSAIVHSLVDNLRSSLKHREGRCLLLMIILTVWGLARSPAGHARRDSAVVAGVASLALFAHLLGGKYGWFGRYEVYAIALGFLALLYTWRYWIHDSLRRGGWNVQLLAVLAGSAYLVYPYVKTAVQTPLAAEGTYRQQYQMHRFVTDFYRGPIAVNDLGWVSYQNNDFVLDLEGLGSEPVRRLRAAGAFGADQMAELTSRYKIGLVMDYDPWFPHPPSTWRRIAVLHTGSLTAAYQDVSFYVTPDADPNHVEQALAEFKPTLPRGDTLDIEPN